MRNKRILIWFILILLFILLGLLFYKLGSFSYSPINYSTNEGTFTKATTNTRIVTYNSKSEKGFYASLDFALTDGKVDWSIVNPKNITVYEGYVIFEQGKVFRELTYSSYPLSGYSYSYDKVEVKNETDTKGNVMIIPDFNYLQFEIDSLSGEYKLILNSINAEGSYRMEWSNKLPRK